MKLKIGTKIGLGFGVIILTVVVNAFLTSRILTNSEKVNDEISSIYTPSVSMLNDLYNAVNNSKMLIRSWVFIDKRTDTQDKINLVELHEEKIPEIHASLEKVLPNWGEEDQEKFFSIYAAITDTLIPMHRVVMERLHDFTSYDDPMILFEVIPMAEEGGDIIRVTDNILERLSGLIRGQEQIVLQTREIMDQSFVGFRKFISFMTIILILVSLTIGILTIKSLVQPVKNIQGILMRMSKGILPDKKIKESGDEIGMMSKALNSLVEGLKAISNFSVEVGKGNFNSDFKPLSENDVLGNSLVDMREELKKAAEEENRRKVEDARRNWATQGLAKFGEILRQNNDNISELSYNIISNLVKYLEANQGGLFLLNNNDEDNVFIELTACYAFNRKKYLEKQIEIGEGLVGRCVLEGETIYLTDIPDDYIKITSGLGDENPTSLLIVPLLVNDEVFGVIEIASFKEIEKYQVDFVEKIGESIAATISTAKINIQTNLLLEQSKQQAEEMASQDEEMRQNMEELRATQEESARREEELKSELEELKAKFKVSP